MNVVTKKEQGGETATRRIRRLFDHKVQKSSNKRTVNRASQKFVTLETTLTIFTAQRQKQKAAKPEKEMDIKSHKAIHPTARYVIAVTVGLVCEESDQLIHEFINTEDSYKPAGTYFCHMHWIEDSSQTVVLVLSDGISVPTSPLSFLQHSGMETRCCSDNFTHI